MRIRPTDLVLEIGSGHNPKVRSDVLCDKSFADDTERGGGLAVDRPLVVADGERLPFRDGAFDYVICCHVLEHARDIARFIEEIQRVGRAGYIETPSEIGELLYGWDYHRWLVNRRDGRLVFRRKTAASPFGTLFHRLAADDPDFSRFHERRNELLLVQHEWTGRVEFEVREPSDALYDLNDPVIVSELLTRRAERAALGAAVSWAWSRVPEPARRGIKRLLARGRTTRRHKPDLRQLIVCPRCHGNVVWRADSLYCPEDDLRFPLCGNVPMLLDPADSHGAAQ